MNSKAKSNSTITSFAEGDTIVFRVRGAQPVTEANPEGAGELRLPLGAVSEAVIRRAAVHGLVQRVSDAAALSRDTKTGRPAAPADKLAAMARLVEHYASGAEDWSPARTGGGGGSEGYLLRALYQLSPNADREAVKAKYASWTKAEREAVSASPKVAPIIAALRAQNAPKLDTDALLAELDSDE